MGRFERALALTLRHEGGFANHPRDPGGATMQGVTQATYDAWRARRGADLRSVRVIEAHELQAIYREGYWDAIRGDDLPDGVAYAVFDAGVMSGPGRAARWLQEAAGLHGADVDGSIGPRTLAAVGMAGPVDLVHGVCDRRLAFCGRLRGWSTFGAGWERRIAQVREQARVWAAGGDMPSYAPQSSPMPRARGEVRKAAALERIIRDPKSAGATLAAAGTAAAQAKGLVSSVAGLTGPLAWGVAVAVGAIGVGVAVVVVRRWMSEEAA